MGLVRIMDEVELNVRPRARSFIGWSEAGTASATSPSAGCVQGCVALQRCIACQSMMGARQGQVQYEKVLWLLGWF